MGFPPIRAKKARYYEGRELQSRILPSPKPSNSGDAVRTPGSTAGQFGLTANARNSPDPVPENAAPPQRDQSNRRRLATRLADYAARKASLASGRCGGSRCLSSLARRRRSARGRLPETAQAPTLHPEIISPPRHRGTRRERTPPCARHGARSWRAVHRAFLRTTLA